MGLIAPALDVFGEVINVNDMVVQYGRGGSARVSRVWNTRDGVACIELIRYPDGHVFGTTNTAEWKVVGTAHKES